MSRTKPSGGRKRVIEAWLVSEVCDVGDDCVERPIRAYQRKKDAELCKRRQDAMGDDPYWPAWSIIEPIEVVVDGFD